MTGIINALEYPHFEDWITDRYPEIFSEWELAYSDIVDLDEYLDEHHQVVISTWNKFSLLRANVCHTNSIINLLVYIRDNFEPEDIFDHTVLSDWAFREGYLP